MANLKDSILSQGAGGTADNAATLDDAALKGQKFDPSKFISEDFLQILNEHRKNCEREGKLGQATLARKRLKELRIFEEQKRKDETFNRHVSHNTCLYKQSWIFLTFMLRCDFIETRNGISRKRPLAGDQRTVKQVEQHNLALE